tara:strand:+ start:4375 stop:5532 length:1158 start_codon:yes stop_codon:yes gene_type:complete
MNLGKFSFSAELDEVKRFQDLDDCEKEIVFYSENKNSIFIFESLIKELIAKYDKNICYVTSSKDKLNFKNEKIKTFFIGEGIARTKFFLNLKTKILIMTMPDLQTFHIKKSKVYPVHYVYIFHAIASTHLVYQKNAFDHFDTIFCVGDYQIKEIRSREKIYNLKPKKLVNFGYNHLDNLIAKYSKDKKYYLKENNSIQILIAPSWGKNGLIETNIDKIIDILLIAKYKVVLRPHPMSQKKSKKKIYEIDKQFSPNPNFILEQNITNFDSLSQSNIMISDWSGIALEFAFTFERPILYVDVPKKILNPDFSEILHTPIEESIRNQIGIVICKSDIESIPKKIEELCNNTEVMRNQIRKAREDTVFNIGKSNKIGAEQIIELLNQLK